MIAIEICGGIAYGKTTLAHLAKQLGITPILEDFQANPFYSAFYQDPAQFAFETELTFSLQHYHQVKRARNADIGFCTDFSPYLDMAYSSITLAGKQLETFRNVYKQIRHEVPPPTLLIHLECEPKIALSRIKRRGRSAELGIQLSYLQDLDNALKDIVIDAEAETTVLRMNSDHFDFANNEADEKRVVEIIKQTLVSVSVNHKCGDVHH
jgi:deoxyadenosine/deoxycytidine kinase